MKKTNTNRQTLFVWSGSCKELRAWLSLARMERICETVNKFRK
jgi:hypothetical protein